jgi:hypothetical protein
MRDFSARAYPFDFGMSSRISRNSGGPLRSRRLRFSRTRKRSTRQGAISTEADQPQPMKRTMAKAIHFLAAAKTRPQVT